jgi:outer membrane protein assembly factor BamB
VTWTAVGARSIGVLLKDRSTLAAFDIATGDQAWERSFATIGRARDATGIEPDGWPVGAMACSDDLLIVPVASRRVVALDLASGEARWQADIRCPTPNTLVVEPAGRVFVFDTRGFFEIDARTGRIVREANPRGELRKHNLAMFTATETTERFLYACDVNGTLFALDKTLATVTWTYGLRASVNMPTGPVVADGLLYQLTSDGELAVFAATP